MRERECVDSNICEEERRLLDNGIRVIKVNNFCEAGKVLMFNPPGVAIIDNDNTMKPVLRWPGRIPCESLEVLREIKVRGWEVAVFTNQAMEPFISVNGNRPHQVAWVMGGIFRYQTFPRAVDKMIGKDRVFGAGRNSIWPRYKRSQRAIDDGVDFMMRLECVEKLFDSGLYVVGDRWGQEGHLAVSLRKEFAERYGEVVDTTLVKVPDPFYARFIDI